MLRGRHEGTATGGTQRIQGWSRDGVRAFVAYLVGRLQSSRRDALEFFTDVIGADLLIRLVSKIEYQLSTVLEPVYAKAKTAVQGAPVVHADEASCSIGGMLHWL